MPEAGLNGGAAAPGASVGSLEAGQATRSPMAALSAAEEALSTPLADLERAPSDAQSSIVEEDAIFSIAGMGEEEILAHFAEKLTRILEANEWFALHEELRPPRQIISDATWAKLDNYVQQRSFQVPGSPPCTCFKSNSDSRVFVRMDKPSASGIVWAYTAVEYSSAQHAAMLQNLPQEVPDLRSNRALKFIMNFHHRFKTKEEANPDAENPPGYIGSRSYDNPKSKPATRKRYAPRKRPFAELETANAGHAHALLRQASQDVSRNLLVRELRHIDAVGKRGGGKGPMDALFIQLLDRFPQKGSWITTYDIERYGIQKQDVLGGRIKWWSFWTTVDSVSEVSTSADSCCVARLGNYILVRMLVPLLGFRWVYIMDANMWSEDLNESKLSSYQNECRTHLLASYRAGVLFNVRPHPAMDQDETSKSPPGSSGEIATTNNANGSSAAQSHAFRVLGLEPSREPVGGRFREDLIALLACTLIAHTPTHVWFEESELRPKHKISTTVWQNLMDFCDQHGKPMRTTNTEREHVDLSVICLSMGSNFLMKTRNKIFDTIWFYMAPKTEYSVDQHEALMDQLFNAQTKAPRHVSVARPVGEMRALLATQHDLLAERDFFDRRIVNKVRDELVKAGGSYVVVEDATDPLVHIHEDTVLRQLRDGSGAEGFSVSWNLDNGNVSVTVLGNPVRIPYLPVNCSTPWEIGKLFIELRTYDVCPGDGFRHPLFTRRCAEVFVDMPQSHQDKAAALGSPQRLVIGAVLDENEEVAVVVECAFDPETKRAQFRARAADCEMYTLRKKTNRFVTCKNCLKQLNTRVRRGEARLAKAPQERELGYGHLARSELKVRYDHAVKELSKARRREDRAKDMLTKQRRENRELRRETREGPPLGDPMLQTPEVEDASIRLSSYAHLDGQERMQTPSPPPLEADHMHHLQQDLPSNLHRSQNSNTTSTVPSSSSGIL